MFLASMMKTYCEVAIVHRKILVHPNTVGLSCNKPASRFSIVHYRTFLTDTPTHWAILYDAYCRTPARCCHQHLRGHRWRSQLHPRSPGRRRQPFAILEANGGATFWGTSVTDVSKDIMPFEEAAYFTALAETIGGSREFGRGVLEQQ